MKSFILSFIVLFLCLNCSFGLEKLFATHLWQKFKKEHGKEYLAAEVESYRFGIFKNNIDLIEKHNKEYSMGMHTYTLGINAFADLTFEEFKESMLGTRFNQTLKKNRSLGSFSRLPSFVKLPDEVDWREQGAVTPVKNQGQCGSCWSFSATGALEGAHFRATGTLVSLSEQQLVDCSSAYNNHGCKGGNVDNAFEYVIEIGGLDSEESYAYDAQQERCHYDEEKLVCTCSGYIDINSGDEDSLKEAVATVGPVSVAIHVTEGNFMLYRSGVFFDNTCSNSISYLNHAVLVVGYGTEDNQDFWIVKNSWGPEWGEEGYIRMARNNENMCGIATSASYPIVNDKK